MPQCTSQVGRPDDGTDTTGFFNAEFFVDLKPKEEWRPVFHQDKDALIAAMSRELDKIPGVSWGFSQPISDNMEEAVSGVKGELAIKVFGDNLRTLESKADEIMAVMRTVNGIQDLGLFRVIGQPNLNLTVNRAKVLPVIRSMWPTCRMPCRPQLAATRRPRFSRTSSATIWCCATCRSSATGKKRSKRSALSPSQASESRWPSSAMCRCSTALRRFIAKATSAMSRSNVACEAGTWAAPWKRLSKRSTTRSSCPPVITSTGPVNTNRSSAPPAPRLAIIVQLTLQLIFFILYSMFKSMKWSSLILLNVAMAPVGGLLALYFSGTNLSVSSGVGFLALFGVSVQVGVIMVEYINQLRVRGHTIIDAATEGAVLRLRPIMMTMLVAMYSGLLPAATSHGIGSDSQRPFALVIVGGLMAALLMSVFLLPTMYVWIAGDNDVLPEPEGEFE